MIGPFGWPAHTNANCTRIPFCADTIWQIEHLNERRKLPKINFSLFQTLNARQKWGTLDELRRVKAQTVRSFFYAHNSRSQSLIEKRLQQIADAHNVTDDFALIEPLVLTTKCLVGQLRQFNQVIKEFDHKIKELFKSHPDFFVRESSGGRRTASSSSSFPVRF
jgi:hypothetical protein